MKVIIPAAGGGTRLRPLTNTVPKVLLHVAGKPIIGHIVDSVLVTDPGEIVVVIGAQGDRIQGYLRANYNANLRFAEQPEPRGLGHAIAMARAAADGSPTLIVLGDTLVDLDLKAMLGKQNLIGVRRVPDPRRFGVVEIREDAITRIVEKPSRPRSDLAIVGVYYFPDSSLLFASLGELVGEGRRTKNEYQLTDALQMMVDRGARLRPFPVAHWLDCGTPDALLETNSYLLGRQPKPVFVAASALVENSVIGDNVSIGENAVIRNSIIRDSILNPGAQAQNAALEHSILGYDARFSGPGTNVIIAAGGTR